MKDIYTYLYDWNVVLIYKLCVSLCKYLLMVPLFTSLNRVISGYYNSYGNLRVTFLYTKHRSEKFYQNSSSYYSTDSLPGQDVAVDICHWAAFTYGHTYVCLEPSPR